MADRWHPDATPNDEDDEFGPGDPDYDLSEAHGHTWEPEREHWPVPPWLLIVVSAVVIVALVLPALAIIVSQR